jgi:ribosomal protein S7
MEPLSQFARDQIVKHSMTFGRKMGKQHNELSRFINILMKTSDRRQIVEDRVVEGMHLLQKKTRQSPEYLFDKAIEMLAPVIDVGSFKSGGKIIRVPLPLNEYRSRSFAYRWLSDALRANKSKTGAGNKGQSGGGAGGVKIEGGLRTPLEERFVNEILQILEGSSPLLQKKAALHREALANRSFANKRWAVGESHSHLIPSPNAAATKPSEQVSNTDLSNNNNSE